MYAWIWRHLPGPVTARVAIATLLVTGVIALLMLWVFPWLEPMLPFNEVAVDGG
ncbi:hypothetical protein ACFS2C_15045 [Prauserella oleivorans]|uniref:Uncharacterized protein n=1 Tax=Prauserella oleivorans TaxID=1478153 RepID=A0ABW5W9P7_9PSEU